MIDVLNRWARFVYGPLMDDRDAPHPGGASAASTAARWPRTCIASCAASAASRRRANSCFMDRAAIGLGSVFMHLKAEINWYRLFHELIEDFDVKAVEKRQTKALKAAKVPAT